VQPGPAGPAAPGELAGLAELAARAGLTPSLLNDDQGWRARVVFAQAPGDAAFITFGVALTGRARSSCAARPGAHPAT
jgi:hypothetical protein